MNVLIVPGYGDRYDYIEKATEHWSEKYGIEPEIYVFGTKPEDEYAPNWLAFEAKLQQMGNTAIIGASFGVTIALRALQDHPDIVSCAVGISGPHDLKDMDQKTVDKKYQLLNESLPAFSVDKLPLDKVMTLRPIYDGVIEPKKVFIKDATNKRMLTIGHPLGIFWAFKFNGRAITDFIKAHHDNSI